MNRRAFVVTSIAAAISTASRADDLVGEALNGYWLVSVSGSGRDRILYISGASASGGKIAVSETRYGWLDAASFSPTKDFRGTVSGDVLNIEFITNAKSLIKAQLHAGEQTLVGSFLSVKGREAQVRMTRIPQQEVEDLRRADLRESNHQVVTRQGNISAPKADSKIVLVYVGSVSCPACRGYEAEYFGRLDRMHAALPDFSQIDYIPLKWAGGSGVVRVRDLPPSLGWATTEQIGEEKLAEYRGTPFFFAAVDRRAWGQGHGVAGLEGIVLPQLRLALQERGKAKA